VLGGSAGPESGLQRGGGGGGSKLFGRGGYMRQHGEGLVMQLGK